MSSTPLLVHQNPGPDATQTAQLRISIAPAHSALLRVLGLAERRGYPPVRVQAGPVANASQSLLPPTHLPMEMEMEVVAKRPIEQLVHQLRKLVHVQHVEVVSCSL